jgi:exonuclease SbcC
MNILRVVIKGFGPFYEEVEVDWHRLGEIVAVVAPNGSGKTFLLEAPFACLYGFFPSRDHVSDELSQGGTGEGYLEVELIHRGLVYTARRVLSDKKHTATLWQEGMQIAGPKVRDFEAAVTQLFGDSATALATRQAAQGVIGDLTTCKPAERRAIMAELLSFDELNAIANKAKDKAREAQGRAEGLAHNTVTQDVFVAQLQELGQLLEEQQRECSRKQAELDAAVQERNRLEEAAKQAEAWRAERARLEQAINNAKRQAETTDAICASMRMRVHDLTEQARTLEQSQKAAKTVAVLEADLRQLMDRKDAYDRYNKALATLQRAEDSHEALVAKLTALKAAVVAPTDEERHLAAQLPRVVEEYQAIKEKIRITIERNRQMEAERGRIEAHIQSLMAAKQKLEAKAAKRPVTPAEPETCERCPLMKEWAGIASEIREIETDIQVATSRMQFCPPLEPVPSEEEVVVLGQRCRMAAQKVSAYDEHVRSLAKLEAEVADAEAVIVHLRANLPSAVDDPSDLIDDLRDQITAQKVIAAGLARAQQAHKDLIEALKTQDEALQVAHAARAAVGEAVSALGNWLDSNPCPPADAFDVEHLEWARQNVDRHRDLLEAARRSMASTEGSIEATNRALEAAREGVALYHEAIDDARDLSIIAQAFGPKGIQALLIDQAAPALEAIAATMLDQVTGGNMRLRIATQRALADGTVAEDFSIMVQDQTGERDVRKYSGGERNLLRLTLRLALCLWLSRISGFSTDSLAIDEAFDALDAENAANIIQLIMSMRTDFSRVILVTHNPALAQMVQSRVTIHKTAAGSRIQIN